jgi:hypothetical protein
MILPRRRMKRIDAENAARTRRNNENKECCGETKCDKPYSESILSAQ